MSKARGVTICESLPNFKPDFGVQDGEKRNSRTGYGLAKGDKQELETKFVKKPTTIMATVKRKQPSMQTLPCQRYKEPSPYNVPQHMRTFITDMVNNWMRNVAMSHGTADLQLPLVQYSTRRAEPLVGHRIEIDLTTLPSPIDFVCLLLNHFAPSSDNILLHLKLLNQSNVDMRLTQDLANRQLECSCRRLSPWKVARKLISISIVLGAIYVLFEHHFYEPPPEPTNWEWLLNKMKNIFFSFFHANIMG